MLRGNQVIGTPVIASSTGRQLHVVKELVVDYENHRLLGFLTNRGGWSGSAQLLPWSPSLTVGLRGIIARPGSPVIDAGSIPRVRELLERGDCVLGKAVRLANGSVAGTLSDVFFEKATGIIRGYEITDGAAGEKSSSRLVLPAPLALAVEGSTLCVSPEVSELIVHGLAAPHDEQVR